MQRDRTYFIHAINHTNRRYTPVYVYACTLYMKVYLRYGTDHVAQIHAHIKNVSSSTAVYSVMITRVKTID